VRSIDIYRHIEAPIDVVWSMISDHRGYPTWTSLRTAVLEVEGDPVPDGVGAVRFLGFGPIGAREQVLDFDPPHHLAYTILSGVPVQGYRADVDLRETADGGTDVRWVGSFDSAPPGLSGALRWELKTALLSMASALEKAAPQRAATASS
jgi:uncharacterized protein YndB with AHSA1/START domain